jgi:hypothetical protein
MHGRQFGANTINFALINIYLNYMVNGYTLVWNFYAFWDVPENILMAKYSVTEGIYLIAFLATGWGNYLSAYFIVNFDYLENEVWSRNCSMS